MSRRSSDPTNGESKVQPVDISVVIPVLDEVDSIDATCTEFARVLDGLELHWEIIFVDDGSNDRSAEVMERCAFHDNRVRVIRHRRNYGKATALSSGFSYAKGRWIATADADLQQDPADIAKLWKKAEEGYDFVNGTMVSRDDPIMKRLPSRVFNFFAGRLLRIKIGDLNSAMKLFKNDIGRELVRFGYGDLHRYFTALAVMKGYRVGQVEIAGHPRLHGKSKFGMERYTRGYLDLVTIHFLIVYRERPMHLFGGLGMVLTGVGALILGFVAWEAMTTGSSMFGTPLAAIGVTFGIAGVQLFIVGMLAAMLRSLHGETQSGAKIASTVGVDRRLRVEWREESAQPVDMSDYTNQPRPAETGAFRSRATDQTHAVASDEATESLNRQDDGSRLHESRSD